MSINKLITAKVNANEAKIIVDSLSEHIYKDVFHAIDNIKEKVSQLKESEKVEIELNIMQAEITLNSIVELPFKVVYELVGKINEQLQQAYTTTHSDSEIQDFPFNTPKVKDALDRNIGQSTNKESLIGKNELEKETSVEFAKHLPGSNT
ncbi:hypothetical protein [Pleionea sediminis]|uniref:hypothetical protein n=1 Tax=Pleionea sediminis TaxID=2569479 RepID=UPI001185B884|nr:hypothetical protein [Pleionea sediminis]